MGQEDNNAEPTTAGADSATGVMGDRHPAEGSEVDPKRYSIRTTHPQPAFMHRRTATHVWHVKKKHRTDIE